MKPLFWNHPNPYLKENIAIKTAGQLSYEDARDSIAEEFQKKAKKNID